MYLRSLSGRFRMVVGFTTTCAISASVVSSNLAQHYVIKLVSDLWQIGDFLRVFRISPPTRLTSIIYRGNWKISLKVALNTIALTLYTSKWQILCFIIWCWFHTQFIYFAQFSMFLYVIEMFTTLLGQSQYRHWHWHHCILQFLKNVVIIIKAKADLIWCWLFCVCRLVFLLPKLLNYLAF
jgi:hypothetical protein